MMKYVIFGKSDDEFYFVGPHPLDLTKSIGQAMMLNDLKQAENILEFLQSSGFELSIGSMLLFPVSGSVEELSRKFLKPNDYVIIGGSLQFLDSRVDVIKELAVDICEMSTNRVLQESDLSYLKNKAISLAKYALQFSDWIDENQDALINGEKRRS